MYLQTWQHQMTTIMQPLQCDLQPQIQETNRTTHIDTATCCRTQRRNPLRPERPQPQPPHTRGTFHRRLQPLYSEKYKVSCSGFLPKTKPMQHSCSHYNTFRSITWLTRMYLQTWQHQMTTIIQHSKAIRNQRFKKRIELRTQEQPLAEHRGGTNSRMKRPQPQPPHTQGIFNRRLQPLYTEKYKVSCSGFLPKTKPMQHSCSHYNAFRSITWLTCISLHTWQQSMTTTMQPSNAIRNQRFKKRIELRTQEQPLVAEHRGGTNSRQKRPQPQPPHTRGTFSRRLQPLYTEKHKVSCSGFPPNTSPMQHSCRSILL